MTVDDLILDVEQHIDTKAAPEKAFAAVLHRLGKGNMNLEGQSLGLEIEPRAGGRWYRDRGHGVEHLWGFVQAIKAPTLLEMSGPMFMSYPVMSHVQYKLKEESGGTLLSLVHRAIGDLMPEHKKGVSMGWDHQLSRIKDRCTK